MTKETVGKIATDLAQKEPETRDPIELQREIHKDYEKNIYLAIDSGRKDYNGDFFVVVTTKKERLLPNVIRNYFFARETCPTPEYDQTVYHYHRSAEDIEFLWVLPSKDTCKLFKDNFLAIAPEERGLLEFILKDSAGELLQLSKKLNGEVKDSILLDKG